MAKVSRQEREAIAARRIVSVLRTQGVATVRTLEQKIADAGPNPMRVQPHILTGVRNQLVRDQRLVAVVRNNAKWLHLAEEDPARVQERLAQLTAIWGEFTRRDVKDRMGEALEIATFRALLEAPSVTPINGFHDLNNPNERGRYSKQELKTFNGRSLGNEALDFIALAAGDFVGIEVKNIREWLYPDRAEVKDAIRKALTLGLIPVIIARRIPYVTFRILNPCGVIMHETFNQLLAEQDREVAGHARDKNGLGYHDIRLGDAPDGRLTRFISDHLPTLIGEARAKLNAWSGPLEAFANNDLAPRDFFAMVVAADRGPRVDLDDLL